MKAEQKTTTSNVDLFGQSSSDSAYCSRRYTISTAPYIVAEIVFGAALQDALDVVGQEANITDAVVSIAQNELSELKNMPALTDKLLNNLLSKFHGKHVVTCEAMRAP